MIPYGLLTAMFALAYADFLWRLPRRIALLMVVAGAAYVGGAIGVEMIGGWWTAHHGSLLGYQLLVALEEGMEMAGIAIFAPTLVAALQPTRIGNALAAPSPKMARADAAAAS